MVTFHLTDSNNIFTHKLEHTFKLWLKKTIVNEFVDGDKIRIRNFDRLKLLLEFPDAPNEHGSYFGTVKNSIDGSVYLELVSRRCENIQWFKSALFYLLDKCFFSEEILEKLLLKILLIENVVWQINYECPCVRVANSPCVRNNYIYFISAFKNKYPYIDTRFILDVCGCPYKYSMHNFLASIQRENHVKLYSSLATNHFRPD